PVKTNLVPAYDQPGGTVTGVAMHTVARVPTRRDMLSKLMPAPDKIAYLVHEVPDDLGKHRSGIISNVEDDVFRARSVGELADQFRAVKQAGFDAIVLSADAFFGAHRSEIVTLAADNKIPVIYPFREYVDAGGLMSYGV